MKLVTETAKHETSHTGNESNAFSIRGGAKAFQILLADLYTNKIRAVVREVCTNAADSHVEAGCADIPFDVHLPTAGDPRFVVRDYGVGMDHETVMHLYTTLFDSTKDTSNDFVGALGLGSKSPFAYTDSFDVTARDGQTRRVYQIFMNEHKIPTIEIIGEVDDPGARGVEVAVPVQAKDFDMFRHEAEWCFLGFAPVPNTDSRLTIPEAKFYYQAKNDLELSYMLLSDASLPGQGKVYIRQGCVIYPVDHHGATNAIANTMAYGAKIVVDVPIGTAQVAPNREALSLDEDTIDNLTAVFKGLDAQVKAEVYGRCDSECNTMLEAQEWWLDTTSGNNNKMAGMFNFGSMWKGQTVVGYIKLEDLLPLDKDGAVQYVQAKNGKSRKWDNLSSISFGMRHQVKFVYHPMGDKLKRATMRYKTFCDEQPGYNGARDVYHLGEIHPRIMTKLATAIGAKKEQFVSLADLDDPGPPDRAKRQQGSFAGAYELHHSSAYAPLAKDDKPAKDECYWVEVDRTNSGSCHIIWSEYVGARDANLVEKGRRIVTLTEAASKRLNLAPADNLRDAIKASVDKKRKNLVEQYTQYLYNSAVRYTSSIKGYYGDVLAKLVDPFDNVVEPSTYLRFLSADDTEQAETDCATMVAGLKEKYPLLFGEVDDDAIMWYVSQRDKELLTQQKGTKLP
jgi:hypothetical protein